MLHLGDLRALTGAGDDRLICRRGQVNWVWCWLSHTSSSNFCSIQKKSAVPIRRSGLLTSDYTCLPTHLFCYYFVLGVSFLDSRCEHFFRLQYTLLILHANGVWLQEWTLHQGILPSVQCICMVTQCPLGNIRTAKNQVDLFMLGILFLHFFSSYLGCFITSSVLCFVLFWIF